jgi:NAD(P)H-hydrate repair Nnr-like enzyme with NAD(P)H-hydrate epimerase domain
METHDQPAPLFRTETECLFPGVSSSAFESMLRELVDGYGVSYAQMCEAASYSMAMVARVALGLTADRAIVGALVSDSLSGWVALAALRHLANAGSECHIITVKAPAQAGVDYRLQMKPLEKMGLAVHSWENPDQNTDLSQLISKCHALICGLFSLKGEQEPLYKNVIDLINELNTPVHCIQAPLGINCDSGARAGAAVVASSTLSLGVPLQGLHKAHDFVGRHYLCDISVTKELYLRQGGDLSPLFSEQPVIQIFPA